MTDENQNISEENLKQGIESTLAELRRLNLEMEEKIRKAGELLSSLPDPDSVPDTDDAEIEAMEAEYTDKIDTVINDLSATIPSKED